MATYLPQQVWGDGPNISDADRAKYFDAEEGPKNSTHWKLKDGYEARSLGRGEKPSKLNSLTTYTNDFDSLHDEYDPKSDRENFGIFKTYGGPGPANSAPPADTAPNPTPEPAAAATIPTTPAVDSTHLAEAKERVQNWGNNSNELFGQDTQNNNQSFINKRFLDTSDQAAGNANQLLGGYMNNLSSVFNPR